MNLNNINSLTLNYKTLTNIINENYNFHESQQIVKSDSETIVTLKSLKQLYSELLIIKDELNKALEKHNYENGLLYFNNLLLTDCYTFRNSLESIINISSLIYNSKSSSMDLDSYDTLLYTVSFVSNFSNTPNISNVNKEYDKQYRFESVHLPYLLLYTPRTTDITKTMTFNSEQTQDFTIHTSNQIKTNPNNKSDIFTEYMAEEITNDAIYDNSQTFITIPTLINYKAETDNTWIYSDNNLNKFSILKFCRLIDIPEVRPTYFYPGDTKLSPSSVLYSTCFMIPEQMTQAQREEFLIEYTGTGKIENGFINEENTNIGGTVYNAQTTNITMTTDEYKAAYNFNELHEDILNKSPIIEFNNKKYLLNKAYPYRCAVEYPAYLQYYFHDYYDYNSNNGGTSRRSNYSTMNLMDFSQVGIAYYEEETDVLCYSENGETKLVKNRIYANRYANGGNTKNTGHEYFTNISNSTPFTQKMKIKHIVYSFVISNESYQLHSNYSYKENPTNEDLKMFNLTSRGSKEKGNRCLTIYGNSSGFHIYNSSNARICSQVINVFCPGIKLDPNSLDSNSDRDLAKDRLSLCVSNDYTGMVGEAGLAILDNATNEENIECRYGYGRKIKGGNPIENKNSQTGIKISDSRRCMEGIYFKILLDVYIKNNNLNNIVLIKRIKHKNRVNMFIRRNNDRLADFYERIYNYPTAYFDTSFNLLTSFYECCYGLPYDKKAENILYNYFIHKKFTKDTFEYSDKYDLEDYDFSNVDEIKQSIMSGELYSELVFKSDNVNNINNIYIASKINSYDDFKNIKRHKYILFDFLNSESIKTIEVGELVEKALIYFKTRDISLIRIDFKSHEYRLEQIKHDNIEELVPDGEDDIDDYGFRYYRYIINPNAF